MLLQNQWSTGFTSEKRNAKEIFSLRLLPTQNNDFLGDDYNETHNKRSIHYMEVKPF